MTFPSGQGLTWATIFRSSSAFEAGRRDADLHAAAGQIRQRQHPLHVGRVGKVDPHVIRHLRHPHAETRRDQGIAAPAPPHPGGAADLQHDLVLAGLEDACRDDHLKRSGRFVLADLLAVDERRRAAGDAIPAQHRQAFGLSCGDLEVPARPNELRLVCRLAPLHERPRQRDLLPGESLLSRRRLCAFAAVSEGEFPWAVQQDRILTRAFEVPCE